VATITIAEREQKRVKAISAPVTFESDLLAAVREMLAAATEIRFPSTRYRADPVAFFREILGLEPWSRQVEILEAVRDNPRVAVRSGHKIGKSNVAAGLALWYYCSFPDARAIMSSTTARQVDQILWRELRMMRARGGRCVACKLEDPDGRRIKRPCPHSATIDGEIGELARTGLKSDDFREVVGFTAREAEAVAGISGRNLLYLVDEASGVPDEIFEAIEGNRAGGARIVMFSNPTRTSGEFFEAFHGKKSFYKTITVSSEETPNAVSGTNSIPGLAEREWIELKREEYGEESALYKIRIKGEHALHEDGRIFSVHAIAQAQQRWHETPESGRLFVGLDPAGPTGSGDETVFSTRRGLKQLAIVPMRGLTDEAHLVHLLGLLAKHKLPRETPVVVVDREGSIGSSLYGLLRNYAEMHAGAFELVGVRASDRAMRQPFIYARMRDELAANLEAWIRDGGAILEDTKLEAELHEWEWKQQADGRLKLTPKPDVKKKLGRSPDRYDALALSVWEPLSLRENAPGAAKDLAETKAHERDGYDAPAIDPYAGAATWENR
jgi:hypothetical protein